MSDEVAQPPHYNQGDIECIDAIRASMSADEFAGYCKGNVIKYTWRYRYKGGVTDLEKAIWYQKRLIETVGNLSTSNEDSVSFEESVELTDLYHGGYHWSNAKKDRVNCGWVDCKLCVYEGKL